MTLLGKATQISAAEEYEIAQKKFSDFSHGFHGWAVKHLEPTVDARTAFIFAVAEYIRAIETSVELEASGKVMMVKNDRNMVEYIAEKYGLPDDSKAEFRQKMNTLTREAREFAVAKGKYRKYFLFNG
jgi:hypothetical protein